MDVRDAPIGTQRLTLHQVAVEGVVADIFASVLADCTRVPCGHQCFTHLRQVKLTRDRVRKRLRSVDARVKNSVAPLIGNPEILNVLAQTLQVEPCSMSSHAEVYDHVVGCLVVTCLNFCVNSVQSLVAILDGHSHHLCMLQVELSVCRSFDEEVQVSDHDRGRVL